jgi:hypothetical protein
LSDHVENSGRRVMVLGPEEYEEKRMLNLAATTTTTTPQDLTVSSPTETHPVFIPEIIPKLLASSKYLEVVLGQLLCEIVRVPMLY